MEWEIRMTGRPAFGTELRRRRAAAGKSLADLAGEVHYSKGYLSKVESGGKAPNAVLARLCDAAVGANGELVALVGRANEPASGSAGPRDADDSITGTWRVNLAEDGSGSVTMIGDPASGGMGEPTLVGGLTLPANRPDVPPDLVLAASEVHFESIRALGQVVSPSYVLPTILFEARMLVEFARHAPPADSAPLWQLAARYAEYMGWMCQEFGNESEALRYTAIAVRLAARAGDESLRPFALVRQADVTLHADDATQTIELATRAQADPAATARIRGIAAHREAQGYALAGDPDASFRALDRSAEFLAEASRAPRGAPILGTTRTPDPTASARGWCLFDLGRPEEAADLLEPGITGFAPSASRARARHAVRTALARVTVGDQDRAAELLEFLADDLRRIDSATVRHDVRLLLYEFRRRRPARPVVALLTEALRQPTALAN